MNKIAQIGNPVLGDISGFGAVEFIGRLLRTLVSLIFVIGAIIFFFMFLTGGIDYIRAGGDKAQLEAARGKIVNAVVGFVLLVAAFAIIKLLEAIFSVDILQFDIPTLMDSNVGGGGGNEIEGDTGVRCEFNTCPLGQLCNTTTGTCWTTSDF